MSKFNFDKLDDFTLLNLLKDNIKEIELIHLKQVCKRWKFIIENIYDSLDDFDDNFKFKFIHVCKNNKVLTLTKLLNDLRRLKKKKIYKVILNIGLASSKNLSITKKLIECGAIPNQEILNNAFRINNIKIANYLIELSKDSDFKDNFNDKSLIQLNISSSILTLQYAMNQGWNNYNFGLALACYNGNVGWVNYFLELGANDYITALYASAGSNVINNNPSMSSNIILKMIELSGNQLTIKVLNTALRIACNRGNRLIFDILLIYGANDLENALVYSCVSGNLEIIKKILCIYTPNDEIINTSLIHAIYNCQTEVVKFLLSRPTEVTKVNNNYKFNFNWYNALKYSLIIENAFLIDYFIEKIQVTSFLKKLDPTQKKSYIYLLKFTKNINDFNTIFELLSEKLKKKIKWRAIIMYQLRYGEFQVIKYIFNYNLITHCIKKNKLDYNVFIKEAKKRGNVECYNFFRYLKNN